MQQALPLLPHISATRDAEVSTAVAGQQKHNVYVSLFIFIQSQNIHCRGLSPCRPMRSRGSSVGIAMGYWLHCRGIGIRFLARAKYLFFLHNVWGSVSLKSNEYRISSPSGKVADA
jgi:hypothetical protein